jgi:formylglycine-generating enzyme required for sulfatase activity/predicted Ser/Thr protein kinase
MVAPGARRSVSCLDENAISAFAQGALEPEAMIAANAHARGCKACHDELVHALHLSLANSGTVDSPLSPPLRAKVPVDTLAAGTTVGRYTVLMPVGRGGMGQVYSAYDPKLDRRVALKLMHVEDQIETRAQERLLREAQSIARLSHPNVVVVHDVGTYGDRVFVAMEFVDGVTLAEWLKERPRTWREILRVFLAAARGLAAAHRAELIHRDFKPQNVMVTRQGDVRVMDFGLARRMDGGGAPDPAAGATPGTSSNDLELTRPGERLGTPRYMAPEQFRGEAVDERTDQFAFCVALYEAVYGAHPFDDQSYLSLSFSVVAGDLRPPPKDRDVPGWLRRVLLRGLSVSPHERHASMGALVTALEADPAVGRRRRTMVLGLVALAGTGVLAARQMETRRREELDRRVKVAVEEATKALSAARTQAAAVRALRASAFESFDARDDARGEDLWRQARAEGPKADAHFVAAERAFETAQLLDGSRSDVGKRSVEARLEHLALAGELGLDERIRSITKTLERDAPHDPAVTGLRAPGAIELRVRPATVSLSLERYERDPVTGRRSPRAVAAIPRGESALAPGSYRLVLEGPGSARVLVPFEAERGRRVLIDLDVPAVRDVTPGFAYVPEGEFWYGDRDEELRTDFLRTVPFHRRRTPAFSIALHETTFREWIAFVSAMPRPARPSYLPTTSHALQGGVRLRESRGGWELELQPSTARYVARAGELLAYAGRPVRASQDWLDFPAVGITPAAAERYVQWLAETGRVPGARFCSEVEWERAARGADDRVFPHGDTLAPGEANFDDTYGRVLTALGPDAVGSHPASRSPFGVDDMAGNAWELVQAVQGGDDWVIRGGGFYFSATTSRLSNREPVARTLASNAIGLRVCASPAR